MVLKRKRAKKLWDSAISHMQKNEGNALNWARETDPKRFKNMEATEFLESYCFVVYASGFRYRIIKKKFPAISEAFHYFDLDKMSQMRSIDTVLAAFGNKRKANSVLKGAQLIAVESYPDFKRRIERIGVDALVALPGIGPITKDHLAKNIGLADVAKEDVWLIRAAKTCKADSVSELIDFLHDWTGETRHVIDVVLWTFGRDRKLEKFSSKVKLG